MINYNELRDGQKFYANGYKKGYEDAKNEFERPHGEWKALTYHTCYCTNCHFDFDIMKCDFMTKTKFCPNCGAEMRKETENLCNDCKLADACTASLKGLTECKTTKCFRYERAQKEAENE